jgi:hypothetical protein
MSQLLIAGRGAAWRRLPRLPPSCLWGAGGAVRIGADMSGIGVGRGSGPGGYTTGDGEYVPYGFPAPIGRTWSAVRPMFRRRCPSSGMDLAAGAARRDRHSRPTENISRTVTALAGRGGSPRDFLHGCQKVVDRTTSVDHKNRGFFQWNAVTTSAHRRSD